MSRARNEKKSPMEQQEEEGEVGVGSSLPFATDSSMEVYQIIDLFDSCFKHILNAPDLKGFIQQVKGDLYRRDYLEAFANDDKRFAYASRWTPARSLAYASLFSSLKPVADLLGDKEKKIKALCVGGGASSELVGLAAVFCRLKEYNPNSPSRLELTVVDIANWSVVVDRITSYVQQNWLYQQDRLHTKFVNADILDIDLSSLELSNTDLITLMFTTNELFSEKRKETIKFLSALNMQCKSGALLLLAESAGSFSNITVGGKQFPVQFLVDTILIGKLGSKENNSGAWEIVSQSDSVWYRILEKEVSYPLKLENMRFFYRLYRKK
ncbi:uncharacterized protein LODBEIA_P09610 [Lodderomyces beijingensis]|uniref:25S rRNA (Uridine(2843)-N(3))-methyltransferase n=1 Tax=Lodderomyces beijingensis TaxID=1775926 RepID=A0ABP0ZKP4_9ASCO